MKTKIGYYPGCALTKGSSSAEYGMSVQKVAEALDIELVEIGDWNCCGASTAHQTNHLLATSLSARNIAIATKEGFEDLLVPVGHALRVPEVNGDHQQSSFNYSF